MSDRLRPNPIRAVAPGDPVAAAIVNTPLAQHQAELQRLYDLFGGLLQPAALVRRGAALTAACIVGTPVYLGADGVFAPAKAAATVVDGMVVPAPSCQALGVVLVKTSATVGDVLLLGEAALDLTNVVAGDPDPGLYFVSQQTAGLLTRTRPAIAVPVLVSDGVNVMVRPQFDDLSVHFRNYRFELACLPAGDVEPPTPGAPHAITSPDAALAGWLPAGHASFAGKAPAGALFGYNIAADAALAALWPPIPAAYAYLEFDRGDDAAQGFHGVPLGESGLCVIDANGLWWMSNCYGDAPWPTTYSSTLASEGSEGISEGPEECPRWLQMRMTLWFVKPTFATDSFGVTSLTSPSPRVTITCKNTGAPGAVGDLEIAVADLIEVGADVAETGYLVVKGVDDGGKLARGPAVEGIASASAEIVLTGDANRVVGGRTYYQGKVVASFQGSATQLLTPTEIRLDNVDEEFFQNTMYLAFPAAQESLFRARYVVPATLTGSWSLSLRFWLLGKLAGELPSLTLTYRLLTRPTAVLTDVVDLPTSGDEVTDVIDTTGTLTAANQYVEAAATAISVAAGDVVDFSVSRADDDGYAAVVGVVQMFAILTAS